ncbi:MAG: hypothetical protein HRU17_20780 [Polyangiaceae bacterium]|nr:hypothetical protein [Polyangiaceae bacterium]
MVTFLSEFDAEPADDSGSFVDSGSTEEPGDDGGGAEDSTVLEEAGTEEDTGVEADLCAGIEFPDPVFEQVIREHINKPTGPILPTDFPVLWELQANNQGITSLEGIQCLPKLRSFRPIGNLITDLTPLVEAGRCDGLIYENPIDGEEQWDNVMTLDNMCYRTQVGVGYTEFHSDCY